jgi:hypothetical protein
MTQSFAEKPELVRWALMHGTRRHQRQTLAGKKATASQSSVLILPLDHGLIGKPLGATPLAYFRILSVGAGDNTGGLQHVRLQLAQRKVTSRQGWR